MNVQMNTLHSPRFSYESIVKEAASYHYEGRTISLPFSGSYRFGTLVPTIPVDLVSER